MHKGFGPLFGAAFGRFGFDEANNKKLVNKATEILNKRFDVLNKKFASSRFLMDDTYSVADAYLFNVLNWAPMAKVDLSPYAEIKSYQNRVFERPATQAAMKQEGLHK